MIHVLEYSINYDEIIDVKTLRIVARYKFTFVNVHIIAAN